MSKVEEEIRKIPITGYEGRYEVGEDGEIYSIGRYHPCGPGGIGRKWVPSKRLKKTLNGGAKGKGKAKVSLYVDGKLNCVIVKKIVAFEFFGYGYGEIRHIDGDQMNCSVVNLQMGEEYGIH